MFLFLSISTLFLISQCSSQSSGMTWCMEGECQNGGTCGPKPTGPPEPGTKPEYCICTTDWTGKLCEVKRCQDGDCLNGGKCAALPDTPPTDGSKPPLCECASGFTGTRCELPENGSSMPSQPTSNTQSTPSDATTMPQGSTQSDATTQPGDTLSGSTMMPVPQSTTPAAPGTVPNECGCQHGGICRGPTPDGEPVYDGNGIEVGPDSCICRWGTWGIKCEFECDADTCQHGGKCATPELELAERGVDSKPDFATWLRCICPTGTSGLRCECACPHGTCAKGRQECFTCDEGWYGDNCDTKIDPSNCADWCEHGTCVNNGDSCVCLNGYGGDTCSLRLEDPVCDPACDSTAKCIDGDCLVVKPDGVCLQGVDAPCSCVGRLECAPGIVGAAGPATAEQKDGTLIAEILFTKNKKVEHAKLVVEAAFGLHSIDKTDNLPVEVVVGVDSGTNLVRAIVIGPNRELNSIEEAKVNLAIVTIRDTSDALLVSDDRGMSFTDEESPAACFSLALTATVLLCASLL